MLQSLCTYRHLPTQAACVFPGWTNETWLQLQHAYSTYSAVALIWTQCPASHVHFFPHYSAATFQWAGTTDNSAPCRRALTRHHAGNKSSIILLRCEHRFGGARASSQPPDTHDYRLGSLINGQTEGYKDSIMAKHRKDRDSWGECTYNIRFFMLSLTHIHFFFIPVEARV